MMIESEQAELAVLYQHRFAEGELKSKNAVWQVLCSDFLQRFVPADATVVDVGAGYCEFINNIRARQKIAVDLNPDIGRFAATDVRIVQQLSTNLDAIDSGSVDVVFMSNFLEHLPGKREVLETLREARRILRSGGRIVLLQPNIRFLAGEYWDYFDHHTPLSDRSLLEALRLAGFKPMVVIARFLPYTMKKRLPKAPILVRIYLRLPWLWRLFGKQCLIVAEKVASA